MMQYPDFDFAAILSSPIGMLGVHLEQQALSRLILLGQEYIAKPATNSLAKRICQQLENYFVDPKTIFDLPLLPTATAFQERLRHALHKIPVGQTLTYGDIASQLQTSARAVGNGCRVNPVPIIIPCHRVTGRDHIGGYCGHITGHLLQTKAWLLAHEANR